MGTVLDTLQTTFPRLAARKMTRDATKRRDHSDKSSMKILTRPFVPAPLVFMASQGKTSLSKEEEPSHSPFHLSSPICVLDYPCDARERRDPTLAFERMLRIPACPDLPKRPETAPAASLCNRKTMNASHICPFPYVFASHVMFICRIIFICINFFLFYMLKYF